MKKMLLLITVSFLFITNAFSQGEVDSVELKNASNKLALTSIDLSSGKGAVTSGLYVNVHMSNSKALVNFTISENDLEITYLRRFFQDKLLVGPNFGYFLNVPYYSGIIIFTPNKYVSTTHWYGAFMGAPGGEIWLQPKYGLALNSISFSAWRVSATYCVISYMRNMPQHTATLKYAQNLHNHFSIFTDVGYDFTNESQLLKLGISWSR